MKTTAELIDDLFRVHRKANGKEYSHIEVCVALDGAIEPSHLGKLRNGTIKNPKRDTLLTLCRFFKIQPTYFFPELRAPDAPEGAEEQFDDPISALMRMITLTPEVKKKLEEFLRALQQAG
jgi:transcriptional regulator with XRE-family HTH domain